MHNPTDKNGIVRQFYTARARFSDSAMSNRALSLASGCKAESTEAMGLGVDTRDEMMGKGMRTGLADSNRWG